MQGEFNNQSTRNGPDRRRSLRRPLAQLSDQPAVQARQPGESRRAELGQSARGYLGGQRLGPSKLERTALNLRRESHEMSLASAREEAGLGHQRSPAGFIAVFDEDPLPEGPARRGEGFADTGVYEFVDAIARQFDDEVTGAMVAGGEELAIDAQTGKAHHGAGGHPGLGQQ
jgi:hypothetical protein